ncbi:MAG TPA: arsinothricin resistance N-acetyltransferase ArsN1 family B [Chthonomonadaceae bacterium]|nr:arsinothricin resistance N-acetyltransferase ArsN1 family B [Chthonomonadaceae bacterium]
MAESPAIRLATMDDAAQIAAIYTPVVLDTPASFEIEPPTTAEMAIRIGSILPGHPWLVCERRGDILGYVYGGTHRGRPAYQWSVETTVYIAAAAQRQGIGRALYAALLEALPMQGFYTAFAGITLPNAGSVGLHEALGFQSIGTFHKAGYKFGRWHDVGWWQRPLQAYAGPAGPPLPLAAVSSTQQFQDVLRRAALSLML